MPLAYYNRESPKMVQEYVDVKTKIGHSKVAREATGMSLDEILSGEN